MSFSSEEIARIHVEINSGDIPDFSEKMRDAAKSVSQLQEEIQQTQKDLGILAARGDQNSDNFKTMQGHLSKLQTQLKNTNKEMKFYTESIDINLMSSNQLNARSKVLANTLNALSKEAEPDRWNELNDELIKVRRRMDEVRVGTLGVSDSMDITGMSMQQLDVYSCQLKARLAAVPRDAANSPEWNRLKKRLDEVTAEQKKASASMSGFSGMLKKMGKGGLWGAVASAAVGALKTIGKGLIESSQTWGDRWGHFTAGMKKGWQNMMASLNEDGGWKHMLRNFREGYELGKKMQTVLDELFEMQNSIRIMDAEASVYIAEQTVVMRDSTKSLEERKTAALNIVNKQKEIAEARKEAARVEYDAALMALEDATGFSDEKLEEYIAYYMKNRSLIKKAEAWLEEDAALQNESKRFEKGVDDDGNKLTWDDEEDFRNRVYEHNQMYNNDEVLRESILFVEKYNDKVTDAMVESYVKGKENMIKADADAARASSRAQVAYAKYVSEINDSIYENAVAKVEEWAQKERIAVKQRAADRQISEEEMSGELERIETERLQRVAEVNKKFGIDVLESTEAVLDNLTSSMNGFTQAAATGSEEALDGALQKAQEVNAELEKMLDQSLEAANAAVQEDMDLQGGRLASDVEQAGRIRTQFADKSTRLGMLAYDKDAEMAQLRSLYDQGLITEEEYQKARVDIIRRYARQAREIQSEGWEEGLQTASNILNGMATMVSSIQEAEAASLDAQMQKELAAAGSSADQRAAIEEKYEAKKLALQKKYANINMGIQIAQTIAAGALAIMQALAQLGPVAGGIMAGVIAATTAAQVAVIVAQRNAVMNSTAAGSSDSASVRMVTGGDSGSGGYSEGGFTGYGGRLEPAGIVHRGEYVVPVPEMRDPEAYSHVMAIERIRSRRSRRNPLPGFADGGYTGSPSYSTDTALGSMMSELRALRRNPIKAYVVLSELDAQRALRDTHLKAGSRR